MPLERPPSPTDAPPRRIGKYEIIAPIGRGGMARVYRARMQGPAGATKEVALKLIHADLSADREFVLMFLDEMRLAMALSHRNIVQTFDAGQASEPPLQGQHFMVMELVEGCSLLQLLDRLAGQGEAMPLELALLVAMELCSALDYAHAGGERGEDLRGEAVVHRDVSPGNVLLSGHGDVKLADFGIAKAAGRRAVTQVDAIKGKLCYMAPEQARGEVGPRSDLFALGAVLYEMLTGTRLRPRASVTAVLRAAERREGPAPLTSHSRPEVPATLDALVAACLAADPEDRPGSAGALREALAEELFALQQARGGSRDPHARLREFIARHRPAAPAPDPPRPAPPAPGPGQETRLGPRSAPATPETGPADRLAQALVHAARAVETAGGPEPHGRPEDPDKEPEDSDKEQWTSQWVRPPDDTTTIDPLGPTDEAPELPESPAAAPPARAGRTRGWIATAGVLCLLAGLIAALWPVGAGEEPAPADVRRPPATPELGVATTALDADVADGAAPAGELAPDATPDGALAPDVGAADLTPTADGPSAWVDARRRPTTRDRRRGFGWLSINALPWARVEIDGRYRGETPLQSVRLPAGIHRVRLTNPETGRSARLRLRVVAGQRLKRVVRLPR